MGSLVYEESGELVAGLFYELTVPFDEGEYNNPHRKGWLGVPLDPYDDEWFWVEPVQRQAEDEYGCAVDPSHRTRRLRTALTVDCFRGPRVSPLVPDLECGYIVVSEPFADSLAKSDLTGLRFGPVKIAGNQSNIPDPKVVLVETVGKIGIRRHVLRNAKNECPFCGNSPLFCPGCRYAVTPNSLLPRCPNCKNEPVVDAQEHKGPDDRRIARYPVPKSGEVLEAKQWDGSDFMHAVGQATVTTRVVDWLMRVHACPFIAEPIRVNIAGTSGEQRKQLELAKKRLS